MKGTIVGEASDLCDTQSIIPFKDGLYSPGQNGFKVTSTSASRASLGPEIDNVMQHSGVHEDVTAQLVDGLPGGCAGVCMEARLVAALRPESNLNNALAHTICLCDA